MKNFAVVGAGICGLSVALQLLNKGCTVTIFDEQSHDARNACSWKAGGMLAPWSEAAESGGNLLLLALLSFNSWPKFAAQFGFENEIMVGGTEIQFHPADRPYFHHFIDRLSEASHTALNMTNSLADAGQKTRDFGVKNQFYTSLIDVQKGLRKTLSLLKQYEPTMSPQALNEILSTEKWICPRCLLSALSDAVVAKGGRWYKATRVDAIASREIFFGRQKMKFDYVVNCVGAEAKKQFTTNIRGVRGEALLLKMGKKLPLNRVVRVLHPRYPIYLIPRKRDGLLYLGATVYESNNQQQICVDSALHLLSAATSFYPELASAEIVDMYVGIRPAAINNLPLIEDGDDYLTVNGLYRHGYLLSPFIASWVSDYLTETSENKIWLSEIMRQIIVPYKG